MEAESPGRSPMQPSHATVLEEAFPLSKPPREKTLILIGAQPFCWPRVSSKSPAFYRCKTTSCSAPLCTIFSHEMASQLCTYIKCLHVSTAIWGLSNGRQSRGEPMPTWYNTVMSQTQPGGMGYMLAWQIWNPIYTNTHHTTHERGKNRGKEANFGKLWEEYCYITWNYLSFWSNSNVQGFI